MRRSLRLLAIASTLLLSAPLMAASQGPATAPADHSRAPVVPFDMVEFGKLKPSENFGEVLAVAVNAKGHVAVLNHPGTATTGPLFGNATTKIWEFDSDGNFISRWMDSDHGGRGARQRMRESTC